VASYIDTVTLGKASALFDRVAAGDPAAFTEVVRLHDADMVRLCFVISGDAELARDATQQAWQRLWARPPDLRDGSKLRSWLLAVAANEARQLARHGRAREALQRRIEASVAFGSQVDPAGRLDLERALKVLSHSERELVALRYILGMDSGEIGSHLGISAVAVRSRLHRIIARLRKELAP
jgi:RNA polymerase sigma-70 factor (ECF subfamily)